MSPKPKKSKQSKPAATQKKGGAAKQAEGRKTVYPTPTTKLCIDASALTASQAKGYLGWQEETDKNKFGADYVRELANLYPRKVRCINNVTNRPLTRSVLLTLKQEILRGKWQFNGESIIIGDGPNPG
jgi:hypothetical protein